MKLVTWFIIWFAFSSGAWAGLAKKYSLDGVITRFDEATVTITSDGKMLVLKRELFDHQRLSTGKRLHVSITDQDVIKAFPADESKK